MACRSQTILSSLFQGRSTFKPAPVKEKSSIRQVPSAILPILNYRDPLYWLRRVLGKRPAPEFEEWLERMGILSDAGELLPPGGRRGMAALGRELEEGRHGN